MKGHGTKGLGICMFPVYSYMDVHISVLSIETRNLLEDRRLDQPDYWFPGVSASRSLGLVVFWFPSLFELVDEGLQLFCAMECRIRTA